MESIVVAAAVAAVVVVVVVVIWSLDQILFVFASDAFWISDLVYYYYLM